MVRVVCQIEEWGQKKGKMKGQRQGFRVERIIQRMRDRETVGRKDVDGGGTEGISKQTGR